MCSRGPSHLMREKAPKILFLMETKQSVDEMRMIQANLPYRCMLAMPNIRRSGGLALLWMEEVDLHVQTYTHKHIDALIFNGSNPTWRLTGFYGWPEEQRKHKSWQLLKHLHTRILAPWICVGDYNEILSFEEKQGGIPKPLNRIEAFVATLLHCGLKDLGFQGDIFTWNNGRDGNAFVQERLDGACAMTEWKEIYLETRVFHLQTSYSDHILIVITTQNPTQQTRRRKVPRRFEEKWASNSQCETVIQDTWKADVRHGSPMSKLFEKIKRCRFALVDWSHASVARSKTILQEKQKQLEDLRSLNSVEHLNAIKGLKKERKKGTHGYKLNINKSYDRVEWTFLQRMMVKLGFDPNWVHLAMETVTTASYSILINGEPKAPTQGIRQGDPLSPYLFLLCAEGVSMLLRKARETGVLKGIKSSQHGVWVSHLLFADNSHLFCQATMEEGQRLLQLLEQYEAASGQAINRHKTTLFFSKNTKQEVKESLKQLFGARVMTKCERYLGLPMAIGKSKVNTFKDL
ncbi:uncharacterized protein LOC142624031 [Castanea sativa]|uniref:uncharacterized protein LOC142624031 n=1 Tax=Castanea sativa TaxID=21020 RepID=UPI003F650590